MINLKELTIKKAKEAFEKGDFTPLDLVNAYIEEIKKKNKDLNAYLEVFEDARDEAKKITDFSKPLAGIPIAVKDNFLIEGKIVSAASKILENYKATYDSTAIKRLKDAGAIFLGRTNMDEFAMGASTEFSAYGVTKNPHDSSRVAGGSSGGSACVVGADLALASIGSDTGGSIRQPSSFCGVVGLKPTYGSISRHGLMAMASSFDCPGPIAKTVEDTEILFDVLKGVDSMDQTTVEGEIDIEVKKIGVPRSFLKEGIDKDVLENFEDSLEKLEKEGYEIIDIDLPSFEYALSIYYILVPAEVSSNMARYDGVKFGEHRDGKDLTEDYFKTRALLGDEVKRRIMLGAYVLSTGYADEYYRKAWQARNQMKEELSKIFEKVDLIAMPTAPTPAFEIGGLSEDPLKLYLADIFTTPANVAGVPAISIPSGDSKGLPVSLQLLAPSLGEKRLFEVGKKFERMINVG